MNADFNSTELIFLKSENKDSLTVIFNLEVDVFQMFEAVIVFEDERKLSGIQNKTFITIFDTFMKNCEPFVRLLSNS